MNQNIPTNIQAYLRRFPQVTELRVTESARPTKRLTATFLLGGKRRTVHFGYRGPDGIAHTYSDGAPLAKRVNYRKRASKITDSKGRYTYLLPGTANSLSYYILW